jgi:hypothetical protein
VKLPAGTGKTEIIAALAAAADSAGERVLVLTHTNAGVDALRRRLQRFGASPRQIRVETIASWSHSIVRHYPKIAQMETHESFRGSEAESYYQGALLVASSQTIGRVLRASYRFVVVDEYQDCGVGQHALVTAVSDVLPVAVFGDPLQSIFDFGGNVPVDWDTDVVPLWAPFDVAVRPWRWHGHNEPLGEWLLSIRSDLLKAQPVVLPDEGPVTWMAISAENQTKACFRQPRGKGSVVAIGNLPHDCNSLAGRMKGTYTVMEELEGKLMLAFAAVVDRGDPAATAAATAGFGRTCIAKVATALDPGVLKKLKAGKSVASLKRTGAATALTRLSALLDDPGPPAVRDALLAIAVIPDVNMYRHEAWFNVLRALTLAENSRISVTEAVIQIRNQVRVGGRPESARVISRPVLIKGLQYDHAVVLDGDVHTPTSLYVALTRARKSLTVLSGSRTLQLSTRESQVTDGALG